MAKKSFFLFQQLNGNTDVCNDLKLLGKKIKIIDGSCKNNTTFNL